MKANKLAAETSGTRPSRIRPILSPSSAATTTMDFSSVCLAARTLLGAAHLGFIDLDAAFETIPPRANHGEAKLVKPQPCGFVAAEPEDSLQSESTCSRLLAGSQPHRLEPQSQRFVRHLEQRAGRDRGLVTTTCADHRQPGPPPCLAPATPGAHKALGPTKRHSGFGASKPADLEHT